MANWKSSDIFLGNLVASLPEMETGELLRINELKRKLGNSIPAPSTLKLNEWPPNYDLVKAWREQQLARFEEDPELIDAAKEHYAENPEDFVNDWCNTYDPRRIAKKLSPKMPFVLFERQAEFITFLTNCISEEESGLVEKSRDMGATWVCCALSVHMWLFHAGTAIGWGSRKQELVDRLGDPSSIFEKMRILVRDLPTAFLPKGFSHDSHSHFMRLVNPENGSSIIGETGDSIGRGGRTLVYFKDESAHYQRAESIEAALMDNTRCQIDISSVNRPDTLFYRRRDAGVEWEPGQKIVEGKTNVFIMDWSQHPEKTKEWYLKRRAKAKAEGLLHVFAREVERNSAASVEGVIIKPEWAEAALDAHIHLGFESSGPHISGLDVADEGLDSNAQTIRQGPICKFLDEWAEGDTGATARRAVTNCEPFIRSGSKLEFEYDCIGVGAGVKAETNRLKEDGKLPKQITIVPWNAGAGIINPGERVIPDDIETPLNKDFYQNFKAQAWWSIARLFENTYRARYEEGFVWEPDDLVSIPSDLPLARKLVKELSQPVMVRSSSLKLLIQKKPDGARSPNLADSFIEAYFPAPHPVEPSVAIGGITVVKTKR